MSESPKILIVDDEPPIGDIVSSALGRRGYEMIYASSGPEALEIFEHQALDLIILDIMMPDMDGFMVCDWIRERSDIPIIMLTAKGNLNDIVHGFRLGADDYITKPFSVKELDVRVEAILRRMAWFEDQEPKRAINIGDITIDAESRTATAYNETIHLTPMEFELLYYLMANAGEAMQKRQIFRQVWGYDATDGSNLVEVGVRRLRAKIEKDPSHPHYIITIRGIGYRFANKSEIEAIDA